MLANLNIVVLRLSNADVNDADTTDRNIRQLQFTREFIVRKDVILR